MEQKDKAQLALLLDIKYNSSFYERLKPEEKKSYDDWIIELQAKE